MNIQQDIVVGPVNSNDEIGFDVVIYGPNSFSDVSLANEAGDVMFTIEYPLAELKGGSDQTKTREQYIEKGSAGAYSFSVEDIYQKRKKDNSDKKNEINPYPLKNE